MVKYYSVVALLGAAEAAVGPLPKDNASFPKFATLVTPTAATDWDATMSQVLNGFVKSGTVLSGLYRAYRNDLYVFPTQKVSAKGASQAVIAQDTGKRSFYVVDSTKIGDYPSLSTDAIGTTYPANSHWVACKLITEVKQCPGGVGYGAAASIPLTSRIIMRAGVTGQIT